MATPRITFDNRFGEYRASAHGHFAVGPSAGEAVRVLRQTLKRLGPRQDPKFSRPQRQTITMMGGLKSARFNTPNFK